MLTHAKDGVEKFTGKEHIGRVLIDAREQKWMNQKLAEKAMRQAVLKSPELKEIRIVGKDFDISLKAGRKEKINRW